MNNQPTQTLLERYLPEETRQDVLAIFQYLSTDLREKAEDKLISLLERILKRNPENALYEEDDFGTLHMLNNSFDKTYQQWQELNGQQASITKSSSKNDLLLSCCFDRARMHDLLWGMYTYLEGDYPPQYQGLVEELQEYKYLRAERAKNNDNINSVDPWTQNLVSQFKNHIVVTKELSSKNVLPDEFIYELDTNHGKYYIIGIDYISDFDYVRNLVKENVGSYSNFIEVIEPKTRFEDCYQAKYYAKDAYPSDFDNFKKYVYSKEKDDYFYFLVKK